MLVSNKNAKSFWLIVQEVERQEGKKGQSCGGLKDQRGKAMLNSPKTTDMTFRSGVDELGIGPLFQVINRLVNNSFNSVSKQR